jgi:hypothetical protein
MQLAPLSLSAPELIVDNDIVGSGILRKKDGVALAATDPDTQKLYARQ